MKLSELNYAFPEQLIATSPQYPPRTLFVNVKDGNWKELKWTDVIDFFQAGDLLVVNNSKVIPRRLFTGVVEILFVRETEPLVWEVLFPSKSLQEGSEILLPGNVRATLVKKGRPQFLKVSQELRSDYFFSYGELPLPPYIQKARGERHHKSEDANWYQTVFAKAEGSLAAPTAGLHFKARDLEALRKKNVDIIEITLHVGLGTFLPIRSDEISQHEMHHEDFEVSTEAWTLIQQAVQQGRRIFCLGTTSARVIESLARWSRGSDLKQIKIFESEEGLRGETKIYLHPPHEFLWTSVLMTNFHQPGSTLLAMMGSFAGMNLVRRAYQYAIEKKFRLFSYGDFSIWEK
jgi:S-adenosylmethionine:tRNA ribosyltransferase-isomerase